MAFYPDFAGNGLIYTYTSEPVAGPANLSTIPMGAQADHQASVDYATQAGTAVEGSDYTGVAGTEDWADGEVGVKTIDITISVDAGAAVSGFLLLLLLSRQMASIMRFGSGIFAVVSSRRQ